MIKIVLISIYLILGRLADIDEDDQWKDKVYLDRQLINQANRSAQRNPGYKLIGLKLTIPGADGLAEGFVYKPSEGRRQWPGVVFLTDVFGIRKANKQKARRLAAQGFVVVMPNIFYRTDRLPIAQFDNFDSSNESHLKRFHQLLGRLNSDQMRRDGRSYVNYLLSRADVMRGKIGLVGHCLTGPTIVYISADIPDQIGAAASFHGSMIVSDRPDSSHLFIHKVQCELYFGHAEDDPYMTANQIAVLDRTLARWGGTYTSELYPAKHGWTIPGKDVYNREQADIAFAKLIDLLTRNLPL